MNVTCYSRGSSPPANLHWKINNERVFDEVADMEQYRYVLIIISTALGQACVWKLLFGRFFREGVKSGYLMVRLTVRGWSATSALTVSKCENFDIFFFIEL